MAFDPKQFLIGITVASAFILTVALVIVDASNNYPEMNMTGYDSTFGNVNRWANSSLKEMNSTATTMKASMEKGNPGLDVVNAMFQGSYSAIKNTFVGVGMIIILVLSLPATVGVVGSNSIITLWVTAAAACITLAVTVSLIYLVFFRVPPKQ